ncbi:AAEL017248-PA [Aedes aegypti]|uniref:AAEL017248-PA n=1 Tax=Aedes aegypti TaxID=7159 RepID=J9HG12_AEDAE|nr:AAEL017248-PA [Aedes aegypti]
METNIQSRIALGQEQMFDSVGAHIHIRYTSTLKKETIERVC